MSADPEEKFARITITLPPEMLGRIDGLAHDEERSRSQWIQRSLRDIIDKLDAERHAELARQGLEVVASDGKKVKAKTKKAK